MKIAVIAPWVPAIKGNSLAASLARSLSKHSNRVDFIVHTMKADLEGDLRYILGEKVNLITLHKSVEEKISSYRYLKLQYFSKIDKDLTDYILAHGDYELILLISNEGRGVARKLRKKFPNNRSVNLITAIIVQELIDYSFDLNREGIPYYIRKLFLFLKPIFRYIERKRLTSFDLVYSNSSWTSKNLWDLYDIKSRMSLALYDDENFKLEEINIKEEQIAVPTASLNNSGSGLLLRLSKDGVPLVAFGPNGVSGLKNLGFLPTRDMCRLISISKATLFHFDYEALGLIPLESLSLGTPVITIPEQGPYGELKDNRFVSFFKDYDSLLKICKDLLHTNQDIIYRQACSNSVSDFRSEIVVGRFLEDVRNYLRGENHF